MENNTTVESLENDPLFRVDGSGLTLSEAINEAIHKSPLIEAGKEYVIQENERLNEAKAGHLPVVNFSGDAGYENRTYQPDPKLRDQAPLTNVYKYKKTELFLTITQNLWAGGAIEDAIDEKRSMLAMAKYDYRNKLEKLVLDVAKAYFDVVYGMIDLKIARKNMKNYEKILKIVTIKEKNGAATKGDVNFIKANVENAKTQMSQTQKQLQDAISKYRYLLGLEGDDNASMPFETVSVMYANDLDGSIKEAFGKNAVYLKQRSYIKAKKYKFLSIREKFVPRVDLAINGESRNEFDKGLGQREKVNVLLNFNYNLYNGGRDEAKAARLLAQMREQNYIAEDIRRKLIYDIRVLHQSVKSLSESLRFTEKEVLSSRKVVQSYWISFQHGTQDLQALQLAQRNLNNAEQSYSRYKKNLLINNFELMQKTGVLLEKMEIASHLSQERLNRDFNLFYSFDELE